MNKNLPFGALRRSLNADALFISSPDPNLYYLTGLSYGSYEQTIFLLTKEKAALYTSKMELGRAGKESKMEVSAPKDVFKELRSVFRENKIRRLAVNKRALPLSLAEKLQKKLKARLVDFSEALAKVRMVKNKQEIALIKKANAIAKKAYSKADFSGSESDIAASIEYALRERGATPAFETIIAGGSNSSYPHHRTSLQKPRGLVLCDFGARRDNYVSDLTRMHYLRRKKEFSDLNAIVEEAVDVALSKVRPGVKACVIDSAVRSFLETKGMDKFFTHSLGHGIGVEVHERPMIAPKSRDVLRENMVFTVEPGVYMKEFGCRIENDVLVTRRGCRVL